MTNKELEREAQKTNNIIKEINRLLKQQDEIVSQIKYNLSILNVRLENDEKPEEIDYEKLKETIQNPKTDADTLEEIYQTIRVSRELSQAKISRMTNLILRSPNVSERLLREQSIKGSRTFKTSVASNPKTPQDVLEYLFFNSKSSCINSAMAYNPAIPKKVMIEMAKIKEKGYDFELLHNNSLVEEALYIMTKKVFERREKYNSEHECDVELINITLHPNVSKRIIDLIEQSNCENVKLAIENKELVLVDCCFGAMRSCYFKDKNGKKIKTVGETLKFTEKELYRKCMYYEKEYCKMYIEWVKNTLGLSFQEE